MGYPLVTIVNSTNFTAEGQVQYLACSSDSFVIAPFTTWKANSNRGICLVTEIIGHMTLAGEKEVMLKKYKSSGTAYSQFTIIQTAPEMFEVTRRVMSTLADDYVEDINEPVNQG
ncbi:hypothetical protein [Photobacterium leiognathi]|uniref:hypothetical protein n=1 Tax=Photobacterium leiognathi TaxID=553611 RepID=UPI002738E474|nr:hypothetical protein [Photobacterium leiognathi]